MMKGFFFLVFSFCATLAYAQYAPQAGIAGSTAIHKTDANIKGWAHACTVQRGYMDIAQPLLGRVTAGDTVWAVGPADNYIVSLGDSGVATLSFFGYISNGAGADFAVFENGFVSPSDPEKAFLELAFVEVSSDGVNFFRFPCASHTDTPQVPVAGVYMNARHINNLAGKYVLNYGTPFDLQELSGISGLDIDRVTHVRVVDVIGDLGGRGTVDDSSRKINDPYPSPIPTGGFDLDAVAVLHGNITPAGVAAHGTTDFTIYPNPATDKVILGGNSNREPIQWRMTDVTGKVLQQGQWLEERMELQLMQYESGIYYILLSDTKGNKWIEKVTRL